MDSSRFLIVGAYGQLGKALQAQYPNAIAVDRDAFDMTNWDFVNGYDWSKVDVILNAAAYTNVDGAETEDGRAAAEAVNDVAVANLAEVANKHDMILVHVSTAYVFDGSKELYTEDDAGNPLSNYAKSKAAGDEKAASTAKHYIVRTDSVIGEGKNFVRTMLGLAANGVNPTVVADQIMRPTFTSVLVDAIAFILAHNAPFGIYNVTNEGEPISWANFTRAIFAEASLDVTVSDTTLAEYAGSKLGIAPRPLHSVLDLHKIEALGFTPHDWKTDLTNYIQKEQAS